MKAWSAAIIPSQSHYASGSTGCRPMSEWCGIAENCRARSVDLAQPVGPNIARLPHWSRSDIMPTASWAPECQPSCFRLAMVRRPPGATRQGRSQRIGHPSAAEAAFSSLPAGCGQAPAPSLSPLCPSRNSYRSSPDQE